MTPQQDIVRRTFYRCLILFLTFISSCVLFDSYVLLADDHVNNVSYFPFMSIKQVRQMHAVQFMSTAPRILHAFPF
jgi:hypothetical protein